MARFLIGAGSAILLFVVMGASYLVLQACAVQLPFNLRWLNACVPPELTLAEDELAQLTADNAALLREIRVAERALGNMQCQVEYPPSFPDLAAPSTQPEGAINSDAWEEQDVAVLEGCWDLDADMSVEDVRTGEVTWYTQWNMCFDSAGVGTERMTATNGVTCEGPVSGDFNTAGRLVIREPANLACSDNSFIYQRDAACSLDSSGLASCVVTQPELGRSSTVRLRRAATGRF